LDWEYLGSAQVPPNRYCRASFFIITTSTPSYLYVWSQYIGVAVATTENFIVGLSNSALFIRLYREGRAIASQVERCSYRIDNTRSEILNQ
jgi:hypothetical protein